MIPTIGQELRWTEIPAPAELQNRLINEKNSYLRVYRLGDCSVIVTKEFGEWHLSIANRTRLPTWDEVAQARYNAIPDDVWMAMMLPPKSEYINIHDFCLQLVQIPPRI